MSNKSASDAPKGGFTRRHLLIGAGIMSAEGLVVATDRYIQKGRAKADVFVAKAESYAIDLEPIIRSGLFGLGLRSTDVKGKSILLKPNLVEPTKAAPHVNTHPSVVRAAAEVFRSWGASEVFVAEGQGHCRDTEYVLEQSGLGQVLDDARLEFVDLNHDDVTTVPNHFAATRMTSLHLPNSLKRADLIVSMAKMKTHHWEGATLSMKNLFGVMPGIAYGWPKNVLHHAGITGSILDVHQAVKPDLAIIDGIVGMEGDGPIMGTAKRLGVLVMGTNFPAVDATSARLMGIDPAEIPHLSAAGSRSLGPIRESQIIQRGETLTSLIRPFARLARTGSR